MNSKERLERLNAYLISKGRKPKSSEHVDFVKQNITVASNVNSSAIRKSTSRSRKMSSGGGKHIGLKSGSVTLKSAGRSTVLMKGSMNKNCVESLRENRRAQRKNKENRIVVGRTKAEGGTADIVSKVQAKPTERGTPKCTSRVTQNSFAKVHSDASVPRTSSNLRRKITDKSQCSSDNSTPVKRVHQTNAGNAAGQYKRLNKWLLAKGKKPFGIKAVFPRFKAVKTIQTPAGSPVGVPQSPSMLTPTSKSHWQGLRDEDDLDEIAVLIRNVMGDVKNCIKEGCPPSILEITLEELAGNLPTVRKHAHYWITLASILQAADADYGKICDVYEKAILEKAQPISEIQEALNEWLLKKVNGQEKAANPKELENATKSVPTNQLAIAHPALQKLKVTSSPIYKNVATSPIIFESPVRNGDASPSMSQSPSSVIKLRMVSKSSPVFNRIKSLRTLPDNASAVITPVRRSTRIYTAKHNYPIGLRDHEPCLSSVQEIFPALGYDTNDANVKSMSCDVVFDPNNALSEDNDIAKVLNF